jgi:Bacterial PH domain
MYSTNAHLSKLSVSIVINYMSILDAMMGNASSVNPQSIQNEFQGILIQGENVVRAYKLVRDMYVFTNKRLILVDKQGITGSKAEYLSVPYKSIKMFSKENAGTFDLDEELTIYIQGHPPIKKKFKKGSYLDEIYQVLSSATL